MIKVDLEKAYDRLGWRFLESTLRDIGFTRRFASIIMNYVSTCSMQVFWNGNLSKKFQLTRRVRQGDPLSPYLFVLCIEKLAHIITHVVQLNRWKPIIFKKWGPIISHLFFAEDLILFAKALVSQAQIIKQCLDLFC